jgi:protein-S-isoprenylcysteine O-methyltransferase Ste14
MHRSRAILCSIVLSAVFSYALLYSTLELPVVLNRLLMEATPHYGAGEWEEAEQFVNSVRPIGYLCLGATIILIMLGFMLKKYKLSFLGSISLLLPTFSYFASVMFFLTGIGVLRLMWLPFIELSPGFSIYEKISAASSILELGDIVYLPYDAVRLLLNAADGRRLDETLFRILVFTGSILFFAGCAAWFYARFRGRAFADLLVYKYSRHPQYLSFLVWSHGLLVYDKYVFTPPRGGYFAPPPFFWLTSILILVGIALREEEAMLRKHGKSYDEYRSRTPFMIPLTRPVGRMLTTPVRLLLKKNYPERAWEIAVVLAVYGLILLVLSILY